MGIVAAYSFSLIGKACEQHNASSFQDAWAKSVDPNSAWTISAGITAMCFLASIAYSIIIGDSFTSLAATFNLPAFFAQRSNIILAISAAVLLPLCSMKSLAALAPFSLLGLGGTLYTAVVMAVRYFDGTYSKGGKFFEAMALAARPVFNSKGTTSVLSSKLFVLVSMLSTSFIAHYNAPAFYNELKDTSMPRFNKVVSYAFVASIVTFVFMMSLGFLTFGGATAGFVLNNYSGSDNLITFARLAIGLALLTGYPFTFSALRDGILDLQKVSGEARSKAFQPLTLGLLTVITTIALLVKDVGFVVSVSGALFGSALMFVVPAVMNIKNLKAIADKAKSQLTSNNKLEIAFNWGMIVTGIVMGALGVIISTLKQFGKM
jgi:sodium-coupled neutral amino acid transporter 11